MPDIFRERSLQKLSSTEQLDGMIPMIRPSFWLVLAGAVVAVAAALLWGIFSHLPVCVDAQGVVSQDGNTCAVLCSVGERKTGTGGYDGHVAVNCRRPSSF